MKDPYAKFDERAPEKWTEVITIAKGGSYKMLQSSEEAILLPADRILAKQMEGNGQFV